ncbi:WRKY domain-containing protein [Pseudozyma hubeiensis]|nr:WRKY domain-containing protein [Pseudozyma hubeiensis]
MDAAVGRGTGRSSMRSKPQNEPGSRSAAKWQGRGTDEREWPIEVGAYPLSSSALSLPNLLLAAIEHTKIDGCGVREIHALHFDGQVRQLHSLSSRKPTSFCPFSPMRRHPERFDGSSAGLVGIRREVESKRWEM